MTDKTNASPPTKKSKKACSKHALKSSDATARVYFKQALALPEFGSKQVLARTIVLCCARPTQHTSTVSCKPSMRSTLAALRIT
jgi:hypothetical protein